MTLKNIYSKKYNMFIERRRNIMSILGNENFLTFSCDSTQTIKLQNYGGNNPVVTYSFNKQNWTTLSTTPITFGGNNGPIYIKGNNPNGFSTSNSKYTMFVFGNNSNKVTCNGSIMSLLSYTEILDTIPCDYCFYSLFYNCQALLNTPSLPATTLASSCYSYMFQNCTGLTSIPSGLLPATTLASSCYSYMFFNCSSLTSLPSGLLPATTLTDGCYSNMFYNCSSLTKAPELLANNLVPYCYQYMFYNCTNLKYIKALFINTPNSYYLENWVNNVNSEGLFIMSENAKWDPKKKRGSSAIPKNWDVAKNSETNVIYYSTSDDIAILNPSGDFGATLISNWYDTTKGYGTLVFDDTITSIPNEAFKFYDTLSMIELPATISEIKDRAFYGCENLYMIKSNAKFAPSAYLEAFGDTSNPSTLTGCNTRDFGINILILKPEYKHYDGGDWPILLNANYCGFNIVVESDDDGSSGGDGDQIVEVEMYETLDLNNIDDTKLMNTPFKCDGENYNGMAITN